MKAFAINITLTECQYGELSADDRLLVDKAKEATYRSYSPYSHFCVGAAVRLDNGEVVLGCNQENAAYSVTICAERTAIFSAQAQFPDVAITSLAIAARNVNGVFTADPVSPCGVCRQAISEQEHRFQRPIRIILIGEKRILIADTIKDLLPLSFEESDMDN